MKTLLWLSGVSVILAAAFFLTGPEHVWHTVTGPADLGPTTVETLERTGRPNDALLGPAHELALMPDDETPLFAMPAERLFEEITSRLETSEGIAWAERDGDQLYARAVTYSPIMRFPDTNHIWVLPVDEAHSAVILYAAAKLGHSDLGKNRERLDTWVELLSDIAR